jgi:hypothetical protein
VKNLSRYFLGIALAIAAIVAVAGQAKATLLGETDFYCCGNTTASIALYRLTTGGGTLTGNSVGGTVSAFGGDTFTPGSGVMTYESSEVSGAVSANGKYVLAFDEGGYLALFYTAGNVGFNGLNCDPGAPSCIPTWHEIWNCGTPSGVWFTLAANGYPALYDINKNYIWGPPNAGAKLVLQNTGDLQLLDASNNVVWHTNTAGAQ